MQIIKTRRGKVEVKSDKATYLCRFKSKGYNEGRVVVKKLTRITFLNIRFILMLRVWEYAPRELKLETVEWGTPAQLEQHAIRAVKEYEAYEESWADKMKGS